MKKVLYVATVVKTHIMEFHIPYLKMFKEKGWKTYVAAKNDYENLNDCVIPYCDYYYDIPFERFPIKKENIKAYKLLKRLIEEEKFDIIHCHTPVGAMLSRLAARDARKNGTKVIYTAHGFHFYTGAPLINWMLYYPVERWLAHYTDVLITINKEDYERAKKFKARQVEYIPGVGIDVDKFSPNPCDREKKRQELGINSDDIVLLSVGELIKRKNHEVVLRALANIKNEQFFDKIQYLICGSGELETYLKSLTSELGINDHVKFLGYRKDISSICYCSDIFISYEEGLPIALMEAMASGLPSINLEQEITSTLIEDGKEGYLTSKNKDLICLKLKDLIRLKNRRQEMGIKSRSKIKRFDVEFLYKNGFCINKLYPKEKMFYLNRLVIQPQKIRKELDIPLNANVLLSVGELNDNKNHRLIIELLPLLDKNVYYVICGRGPLTEEYIGLANKLNVQERLRLVGYVNNTSDYYRMADLFVFPSKREGLPVSVMEAMASGLPVIATDIRGSRDLLFNTSNMLIDLNENKEVLIKSIYSIINKRNTIELENVKNAMHYDYSSVIEKYNNLLDDLMIGE